MNFEEILYTFVIVTVVFVAIIVLLVIIDMAIDGRAKKQKEVVIVKEPQIVTVVKEVPVVKPEPVVVTKTIVKKQVEVPTEDVPYISVDNGSGKPVSLNLNVNGKKQQVVTRNKKINVNFE